MPDSLLRVLACGSVDDGKSTLIGRLLFECGTIPDDVMAALERDSKRFGTVAGGIDYALLVDGLAAERDQGITIDVAYRFFETPRRRFILADAPGHEQYTRNMVTGASRVGCRGAAGRCAQGPAGADPAARGDRLAAGHPPGRAGGEQDGPGRLRSGGVRQDRHRLLRAARQAGAAGRDRDPGLRARRRQRHRAEHADALVFRHDAAGRAGRRRTDIACRRAARSACRCSLSRGPTIRSAAMPARWPPARSAPGATVVNATSGTEARVSRIVTMDGDLAEAVPGDAVTLVLDREIDVSRGDVLAVAPAPALADQVTAWVVWMDETPLFRGRAYLFMLGTRTVVGTITDITNRLDVDTLAEVPVRELALNEIGRVTISLAQRVACERYAVSRELGGFILIDRLTRNTVGAGMVTDLRAGAQQHPLASAGRGQGRRAPG